MILKKKIGFSDMSKAVKTVVAVGLIAFAPQVSAYIIGEMGVAVSAMGFYANKHDKNIITKRWLVKLFIPLGTTLHP